MKDREQLLERVQAARLRYEGAIALERPLFDKRMDGETHRIAAENYQRWNTQHRKVVEALGEYDAAVKSYLAAIKRA